MKTLVLNDGRTMEVQTADEVGGALRIRMILTNAEQIKTHFGDVFSVGKMVLKEDGVRKKTFEGYTSLTYIKEETGGIWEVEMIRPEAEPVRRIENLEKRDTELTEAIREAIIELTMVIATSLGA